MKEKLKEFIKVFNPLFDQEIFNILDEQTYFSEVEIPQEQDLKKVIYNYAHDGKRIRPFLIYFFSEKKLSELTNNTKLYHACMASELFHLAALIHDDIMDQSDTRRGVPTIHAYMHRYAQHENDFGKSLAILMGDVFITASLKHAHMVSPGFFIEFNEMIQRTIRGQILDITSVNNGLGNVSRQELHARHTLKTAWYTFGTPGRLGFQMNSNNNPDDLDTFTQNLLDIGILFQIRDDIIDCIDEASGKPLFGDIREGQTTWVTLLFQEQYPEIFASIQSKNWTPKILKETLKTIPLKELYGKEFLDVFQKIEHRQTITSTQKIQDILELLKLR